MIIGDSKFLILLALVLVLAAVSLISGPTTIDLAAAGQSAGLDRLILLQIRLPRTLLAILVGAALGLAGAALQSLLRNPLAGPGLIGVSNCAALGAVAAMYFGFTALSWLMVPFAGMLGAAVAVLLIFLLAGRSHSVMTLLLAGIAVNAFASALIALALNFADNPYAMAEMVYWLLGSVANRSYSELTLAAPLIVVGTVILLAQGAYLNALTLGEDTARSLGFSGHRHRLSLILGVALTVGAAVSVTGSIGFIGLLVPHICRPLCGHQPSRVLLFSIPVGAAFLLAADLLSQALGGHQEIKLGVVTALLGGPFFLYLVLHNRDQLT